jgi:hypothetical protein
MTVTPCVYVLQRKLLPIVAPKGDSEAGNEPVSRPLTRALSLILVEAGTSASSNDYKAVVRAVLDVARAGLRASERWPLLPDVLSTVLAGERILALGPMLH